MSFDICIKKIFVSQCTTGVYLRWWFNGWHYYNFTNGYQIQMDTASQDIQVSQLYSVISKIERDTRIKSEYSYQITLHGIQPENIAGFTGLLMAEKVEQLESGVWREVWVTRGDHLIKQPDATGYILDFEITRYELPNASSVYQKSLRLYIGDTQLDMDDDEIVPINKQVNNIAEMQDRQSDFTAEFRVRKTRAMRALFELSGEVGANTTFPYLRQPCRLVQDNIEIITGGLLILEKVTDEYYHVTIMSGNTNFFNLISNLKLVDLDLASTNHTWEYLTQAATHVCASPACCFVYPLCEPSDDGGIAPLTDDGDRVEMYGGWIWCFVKVKCIWEEIFENAEYTVTGGEILESDYFDRLYMPIVNRTAGDTSRYHYMLYNPATHTLILGIHDFDYAGNVAVRGADSADWVNFGFYTAHYSGTHQLRVVLRYYSTVLDVLFPTVTANPGGVTLEMTQNQQINWYTKQAVFEGSVDAVAAQTIRCYLNILDPFQVIYYYEVQIVDIENPEIGYGSDVYPHLNLPDMTQIDFIKLICNMFGLVPEVNARDHEIRFWNYRELYENIPVAVDWSKYLSEREDEVEFKFGDYAQNNYLKYKQSDDVLVKNGIGNMQIDDETLEEEKDMVEVKVSTCDEVEMMDNIFAVRTSRIAFNEWDDEDAEYKGADSIDARIVYIDNTRTVASPPYYKTFAIRDTLLPGGATAEIATPLKASSLEVSFSTLISYYSFVSRLLTRTNLRRVKFNLPVYQVAGLRHNVPIYLSQYKAYFYVNKISNFVPGRLCTAELIRL